MDTNHNNRILSLKAVLALTSLSRSSIWRMYRAGLFPRPIQLSPNRIGWSEAAVRAWINARLSA